jgi:hypothetical protein
MQQASGGWLPIPQPLNQISPQQLRDAFGVSDFFVYEADYADLAPGATAQYIFTVQADSNFLWQDATYSADIDAAAYTIDSQPVPNCVVTIQDTSSGRQLMSNPVPVPNIFGLGREPYSLKNPRWFRANTQVTVSVTNFDAAVTYNLRLSLIGTKFFNYPG